MYTPKGPNSYALFCNLLNVFCFFFALSSIWRPVPTWWAGNQKYGWQPVKLSGGAPDRLVSLACNLVCKPIVVILASQFPLDCWWWWSAGILLLRQRRQKRKVWVKPLVLLCTNWDIRNLKALKSGHWLTHTYLVAAPLITVFFLFYISFRNRSHTQPGLAHSFLALPWYLGHYTGI